MKAEFKPIPVLNRRIFKKNKGRNIVAVLAILMTAMMFTTLFTLVQSMNKNLVQMAFYQNGYDAQVSFKSITEEEAAQIADHHDVKEVGTSIVLGLAENEELLGRQVELDGVSYKVMAVTSVLDPVDKGSLEAGSEENRSSELCKFHGDGDRIPQKGICDDPERGNDEKAALPDAGF